MRRRLATLATAFAVAMAMAIPVGAAVLHAPHRGTSCPGGFEELHFVNNQTGGVSDVFLFVVFDTGTVAVGAPHKSTGGTNHWTVAALASQTLISAATSTDPTNPGSGVGDFYDVDPDGVGRLVLSDYKCKPVPDKPY